MRAEYWGSYWRGARELHTREHRLTWKRGRAACSSLTLTSEFISAMTVSEAPKISFSSRSRRASSVLPTPAHTL